MIVFMYSNQACEHQAISCIKSMEPHLTDDIKVVYFTIGFISDFQIKNLIKVPIPERKYPTFHYYKAELSLDVLRMFPEEQNFIFTDTDILFSRRMDFHKLVHTYNYPLGVHGPHEQPYIWERTSDGQLQIYNENLLMQYFNVSNQSVRYQWSCFYVFNRDCEEFFEEYTSMCKNEYLITRRKWYYPFHDETAFNVCIWKRGGTESLGHIFVNTHDINTVKMVEESSITDKKLGKNIDEMGGDWEYVHDSNKVLLYHGFKEEVTTREALTYLTNTDKQTKNIIIISAYINTEKKEEVLYNSLLQLKKLGLDILIMSNSILSPRILELCDYHIYDKENFLLPIERSPVYWYADDTEVIELYNRGIGYAIVKKLNLSLHFIKNLAFENFLFAEYDNIFHDEDLVKIENMFFSLQNKSAFFCQENEKYIGTWLETRIFAGNVDFFIKNIPMPKTYEEWILTEPYASNSNTLEIIFGEVFKKYMDVVEITPGFNKDYFTKSQIDLFSIAKEASIVYNINEPSKPLLFLIGKNKTYEIWIDNELVETVYMETGDFKKYYFDISNKEVIVKVKLEDLGEYNFTVNTDNINTFKEYTIRRNL